MLMSCFAYNIPYCPMVSSLAAPFRCSCPSRAWYGWRVIVRVDTWWHVIGGRNLGQKILVPCLFCGGCWRPDRRFMSCDTKCARVCGLLRPHVGIAVTGERAECVYGLLHGFNFARSCVAWQSPSVHVPWEVLKHWPSLTLLGMLQCTIEGRE